MKVASFGARGLRDWRVVVGWRALDTAMRSKLR